MARTRLGPDGYGVRPVNWTSGASPFTGKTPAGGNPHPVGRICQFQVGAWGGRRYGVFTGRSTGTHPVSIITQLTGLACGGRRYGSFASKTPGGTGSAIPVFVFDYRRRR